jgi:hypothetical protein
MTSKQKIILLKNKNLFKDLEFNIKNPHGIMFSCYVTYDMSKQQLIIVLIYIQSNNIIFHLQVTLCFKISMF